MSGHEQVQEVEYLGHDAIYLGFVDGEGKRQGPGTVAWRSHNPKTGRSEVEFDEGLWQDDQTHGMFHQYRMNGFEYRGVMVAGKRCGEGLLKTPMSSYEGGWMDNLKHG